MGASLAEELGAALDGVELPSGDVGAEVGAGDAAVTEVSTDTGASGRDEQGRFTGKAAETGEPAAAQAPAADPSTQAQPQEPQAGTEQPADAKAIVTPPATWSAGAKAIYSQLPEVARREIAKREQDYARGIQQHAEAARGYQNMMREFQPYEAMIRHEGGSPEGAIRDLMKTAYALRTGTPQDRGQLVMQIAQRFGADLSPYLGQQAEQPAGQTQDLSQVQQLVQQLVSPALQKIQQWEHGQVTAQQREAQQMEQEVSSQIEAFQHATNEDGTPKHLYYENVRPLMSAYFANGQAKTLEQAYDMACWANPEVRAALQADMQRSADAQRLEEAKRKTQDAGRAGFNVSGQGGVGISGATQSSLRDELSNQLDAALGGQRV